MPRLLRLALAASLALVLLAWAAAFGLSRGWWRMNHPSAARFPVWGIDVSHHQGHIDWPAVAATPHVKFAYLKATEGADWSDPLFRENYVSARRAGLRAGAYHFFTFCRSGAEQARNFLARAPRDADAMPPAVDLELGGNCEHPPDRLAIRASLVLFLRAVEAELGRPPIVYVTREAYEAFLDGAELPNRIWIRDVWTEPAPLGAQRWTLWQFANRGHVHGIRGPVDLDLFSGSAADFGQL